MINYSKISTFELANLNLYLCKKSLKCCLNNFYIDVLRSGESTIHMKQKFHL